MRTSARIEVEPFEDKLEIGLPLRIRGGNSYDSP